MSQGLEGDRLAAKFPETELRGVDIVVKYG